MYLILLLLLGCVACHGTDTLARRGYNTYPSTTVPSTAPMFWDHSTNPPTLYFGSR